MTLDFPTLQTDRLILRGPKPSDVDPFMDFYASGRSQYTGGPMTPRQAWNFFGTEIGHWVMRGFGMFVVTARGSDDPLGIVGHWYPHGWPEKEVGWVLFDAASEGQGIAREAAEACIDHAWNVLGWETIVSYIDKGNDASVRLAERLGCILDAEADIPNPEKEVFVYRHPHPGVAA
ncbi:GNAT family N-acetyltransferase [uncultured Roseobacter sp.]|uniref:GNAT family N-acetyltransferase n=1 Tax=uncultured Roseobacter sp. TaxID=114847 RepID=UPI0026361C36|nr:GNAT family N-acetyltransferase [uncultured Roseobacter sp.]